MKRRLIVGERLMYAKGERPVNCVFSVTLEGQITEQQLQSAFARLQARHPLLRAVINEEEQSLPYFDIAAAAASGRVEVLPRITADDWINVAEAEWKRPFDYKQAPLMRVLWLDGGPESDLVIVLPHCICDGGTIVNLMRELLAYAADPEIKAEPYASFTWPAELVAAQDLPGKGAVVKAKLLSPIARGALSLITRNKQEATGRDNYMIRWTLDRAVSQQIMAACKTGQTSVQAALGTAFLRAFSKVMGKDAKNKLVCPVDIRKSVPGIREDMMFAFAPVVELKGATGPDNSSFWEQARSMKAELQLKVSKLKPNHLLVLTEYFHPAADKMLKHLRTSKGGHDVTLSNMGKINIPLAYQGFRLKRVYSPSTALPWKNPNTLVVTSFDGQLDFSFISEQEFLPSARAAEIKDAFMTLLQEVTPITAACI